MISSTPHLRLVRNAGRPQTGRSAFTLLELILAITVLVALASLSWPGLMRSLRQQSVQQNAEQVRQVLDRARVRAVEEGRTLQVRYEPHGRKYVILPFEQYDPADSSASQSANTSRSGEIAPKSDPFRIYELAKDCSFHVDSSLVSGKPLVTERLGEAWVGHLENGTGADSVGWSQPVLYYPDGSATDSTMVVIDQDRQYIKLHVRGLTGAVWLEPLAVMSERLGKTGN